jgi:hypothetical protein
MTLAASIVSVLVMAEPAAAATIYGIIREGGRPAGNAPVTLSCSGAQTRANTDDRGTYRLTLARSGRCTLAVRDVSAPVILYEDPTRYDFEIVGTPARLLRR